MLKAIATIATQYTSTMSPTNTPAQNMAAFSTDIAAAVAADKMLYIPAGEFPWGYTDGTQLTTALSGTDKLVIRGAPGGLTRLVLSSGSTTTPWLVSTEAIWTDYAATAVTTVTSGVSMSTNNEVTRVTVTSPPASMVEGEMLSLYSNDRIQYTTSPYELNFSHEMSEVLDISGSDIFLARKLNRTYTVSNTVKLRRYNNRDIVVDINDIVFDVDGNIYDSLITSRPPQIFELIGIRSPKIGSGVHIAAAWAGGLSFNCCAYLSYEATSDEIINGTSAGSVLGYSPRLDGVNLMPRLVSVFAEHGRHLPTTTWVEAGEVVINNTGYVAGAVNTVLGYATGASSINNWEVGDQVYLDLSTITGTLNAMPVGWYTLVARTGSSSSGTITVAFNSTGLTFTSGTGIGQQYKPSFVRRYGECEGMQIIGCSGAFAYGAMFDEHENANGTRIVDGDNRYLTGFSYGTTTGRSINNRGSNLTVDGFYQEKGAAFITLDSFGMQHGIPNTCVLNSIRLHDQQDKASGAYYISTVGLNTVTDKRKLIINDLTVSGGAYLVLDHVADAGDVEVNNFNFNGDWGDGTNSSYMIRSAGGVTTINGGTIDLSNVVTTVDVRIAQCTAGKLVFKNVHFRNLASTGQPMIDMRTGVSTVDFEDCTFEYSSGATDATSRFLSLTGAITGTVNCINCRVINGAKIGTSGLFRAATSGGVLTVNIANLTTDASITLTSATAGGSVVVKSIGKLPVGNSLATFVGKATVNNTAVGNVTTGEDNLITYSLPINALYEAGRGVRITAWGTGANNANAKTLKLYFGTAVILTNSLTTSQANTWRMVAEVFSTGTDTQDYIAQFLQAGTVAQTDIELGTATQDDGAVITIKCTGDATATNDIVQEGLIVEIL